MAKHKTKTKSNGADEIKPAPRKGPYINLRFRTRDQKRQIAKAAKAAGLSMNTFVVDKLEKAMAG